MENHSFPIEWFSNDEHTETFSWHALTLESNSNARRNDMTVFSLKSRKKNLPFRNQATTSGLISPKDPAPVLKMNDTTLDYCASNEAEPNAIAVDEESCPEETIAPLRRRGKLRSKKRKCHRVSMYGIQTEVKEPPEPFDTQVSQIDEESNIRRSRSRLIETKDINKNESTVKIFKNHVLQSFIPSNILKTLWRGLDREAVEWEFNAKMRYALEEAYRFPSDLRSISRNSRQKLGLKNIQNYPRLYYRASTRFELLDSISLIDLSPLEYLARHVHISRSRKNLMNEIFNNHREDSAESPRYLLSYNLGNALQDFFNRTLQSYELDKLEKCLGKILGLCKIDFRTWCGIAAFAERLLVDFASREQDPPDWLERADFEGLDMKLNKVRLDKTLAEMLKFIRDK